MDSIYIAVLILWEIQVARVTFSLNGQKAKENLRDFHFFYFFLYFYQLHRFA